MAKEENKGVYTLVKDTDGEVTLSEDVVAVIAGYAATDVEGVASMAGNLTADLLSKVGFSTLSKGIKVSISEGSIAIDATISVAYGYPIPATSQAVQKKVKVAVENMTGLTVTNVNIRIAGIEVE